MTTTQPDRRTIRHEAKRAEILAQAWLLAQRDGLAAISLRDLADSVGLRQPSLYVYFDSKLNLYDAMFADGYRQLLSFLAERSYGGDPRRALARFLGDLVQFSSDDIVRHQMLFQRTIPGFEPSPEAFALALDFYEVARQLLAAVGVTDQRNLDIFSAMANGLAHQQVANEPGGRRWVRLAGRVTEMFLADIDRRRST
ncbi:MAG TPA: TetR/AcrR family transcriptional regulator [Acidothermaceae bacterium]|jgi:AcrR family transcriptional regulator